MGAQEQRRVKQTTNAMGDNQKLDQHCLGTHKPASVIDHILSSGPPTLTILGQHSSAHPEIASLSDHSIIWSPVKVTGGRGNQGIVVGQNRKSLHLWKIDLDRKNKPERTQFQDTLLGRLDIPELRRQPPEIVLQTIAYQAVESTIQVQPNKRHQPSFRSTYKNGWSPQFVAYKVHLATLIEISARLLENGRRQSPRPGHAAILKHLTTDWTNQIIAIDPPDGLWPTLDITGIGPLHLNTFTFDELGRAIPDQIKVLKRKMHGKQRTALRV